MMMQSFLVARMSNESLARKNWGGTSLSSLFQDKSISSQKRRVDKVCSHFGRCCDLVTGVCLYPRITKGQADSFEGVGVLQDQRHEYTQEKRLDSYRPRMYLQTRPGWIGFIRIIDWPICDQAPSNREFLAPGDCLASHVSFFARRFFQPWRCL